MLRVPFPYAEYLNGKHTELKYAKRRMMYVRLQHLASGLFFDHAQSFHSSSSASSWNGMGLTTCALGYLFRDHVPPKSEPASIAEQRSPSWRK